MSFFDWVGSIFKKPVVVPARNAPTSPTNTVDWMEVATTQLGVKEIAGSRANPDIVKYHKTTGGWSSDEIAWCASFVNWVMMQCGLSKKDPGLALAVNWLKFGVQCQLKHGAIVVLKTSIGHHVTFCQQVVEGGFVGRGGNQSNACKDSNYTNSQILGCRWPK